MGTRKKETDPIRVAAASQRVRNRNQVVVVDPNHVIRRDDLFELGGKVIVDPHVSGEIPPRKLGEVKPEVQDWPQHPVGETVVILMVVLLGEIGDHIGHIFVGDRMHRNVPLGNGLAAPAEPHASITFQCWP
jgi:hypothetical protein